MGKLGGGELNVSSDVDLVFVYPEDGETDGARAARQPRVLRAPRAGASSRALHDVTPDGYVFRVDMRLRPYGESGPLAVPFSALEQYLDHAGPRVGALRLAQGARADRRRGTTSSTRSSRRSSIRKYLDFDAYDGLRDVHRQIREQGKRRDYAPNIKLGPGGIREIEFIVQALQLVRGGREPALRARGTLPALAAIAARGLLPGGAVAALRDAYVFLRNLEHRLQYRDDRQTQTLPADAARARGARARDGLRRAPTPSTRRSRAHRGGGRRAVRRPLRRRRGARRAGAAGSRRRRRRDAADRAALAAVWRGDVDADTGASDARGGGLRRSGGARSRTSRACARAPRYLQLPALSRQRVDALVPQLLAAAAAPSTCAAPTRRRSSSACSGCSRR